MSQELASAEGVRNVRTERSDAGQHYARMLCPMGVSMTSIVTLVPMEYVKSYFTHEIASEGRWRSGVPVILVVSDAAAGKPVPPHWFGEIHSQMRRVRQRKSPTLYRLRNGEEIDIGILDVTIALHAPEDMIPHLIESETFSRENFAFLDYLTGQTIHNEMVFASAFHNYHSNGTYHYHFHNLIFGLYGSRRESDGKESTGPIDLMPLIDA